MNHRSYRKTILAGALAGALAVVLLLTLALFAPADGAQAQNQGGNQNGNGGSVLVRQVTVVGVGEVNASPDTAHVQMGVETEAKTAQEALRQNTIQATRVISQLEELGVAKKDIQTSNFNISSVYDNNGRKVTGYRVENTVSVTIRDMEQAGELLDEVVSMGANRIYGISFSVEEPEDILAQAREKAMDNALERATQLAKAGGASVGQVLIITENIGSAPQPMPMMARGFAESDAMSAAPVEPGQQAFLVQVQVTYELK